MIYRAIIENNISPLKDGRVQVRIFGIHDLDNTIVKTKDLPWAEVEEPLAFGFSSGVGFSSIPNIGTWVFVRLDHNNPNMPIITSAISGKSTETSDFPFPLKDRLNEEDQNRLQRVTGLKQNDNKDAEEYSLLPKTIHKKINDTRDNYKPTPQNPLDKWPEEVFEQVSEKQWVDKKTAKDDISGAEFPSSSNADATSFEPVSLSNKTVYPDDAVIETKSGHVIEIDDTPDNEKIRVYHKSGSYIDFRPLGDFLKKIVGNVNKIVNGYIETHIKGYVKTYIEGNVDEIIGTDLEHPDDKSTFVSVKKYIKGTLDKHIAGYVKTYIEGNMDEIIEGYVKREIALNLDEHIKKNKTETIDGGVKTEIKMDNFHHLAGYFKITADGNLEIINDVKVTGSLEVSTAITAGSDITSKSEVADFMGNLSSLRNAYDAHFHVGNLGVPTATPTTTDPKTRASDFTWSKSPKGFK